VAKMFHFFGMSKSCRVLQKRQVIMHAIYERILSAFMRMRPAYYPV